MSETPARHAVLFELIRQDNLARATREKSEKMDQDTDGLADFARMAMASLRA